MNALSGRLSLVLRLTAAAVFLYAGWEKMRAPQEFADNIAAYRLLPAQLVNLLALSLPPLELIIGCLLLTGWQTRVAALSALMVTGIFMGALVSAILRGLVIDCGCFGSGVPGRYGLWPALFRDLILGAALLFIYCDQFGAQGRAAGQAITKEALINPGTVEF